MTGLPELAWAKGESCSVAVVRQRILSVSPADAAEGLGAIGVNGQGSRPSWARWLAGFQTSPSSRPARARPRQIPRQAAPRASVDSELLTAEDDQPVLHLSERVQVVTTSQEGLPYCVLLLSRAKGFAFVM